MSGNLEIGLESDTQVGIDNMSFNIKTTYIYVEVQQKNITSDICLSFPQDIVSGVLVLDSKSEARHDGITFSMEGVASLQLSARSVGLIESIVNSSKVE